MSSCNTIDQLAALDADVLCIVVQDGEKRLMSQLHVAAAADQRTLTFAGFTITAATAAIGGLFYVYFTKAVPRILLLPASVLVAGMCSSALVAVLSAKSRSFFLPGMRPSLWRPDNWASVPESGPHDVKHALLEQAHCLEKSIVDNREDAVVAGKRYNLSIDIAITTILLTGCLALLFALGAAVGAK